MPHSPDFLSRIPHSFLSWIYVWIYRRRVSTSTTLLERPRLTTVRLLRLTDMGLDEANDGASVR